MPPMRHLRAGHGGFPARALAFSVFAAALAVASVAGADIPPSPPGSFETATSRAPYLLPVLLGAIAAALLAAAALRARRRTSVPGASREGCGTLVVAALALIVLGVLLALPHFLAFRPRPRFSEARSNLGAIRSTEVAYFAEWNVYVGGQPPTPVADRHGSKENAPWESDTRFSLLGFAPEGSVRCSYSLAGPAWPTAQQGFSARAECDLDGDGDLAVYSVTSASSEVVVSGDRDDFYR